MRKGNVVIAATLGVLVVISIILSRIAPPHAADSIPREVLSAPSTSSQEQGGVRITEKNINYGTEHITVDIQIPVISGLGDAAFEEVLNAQIENQFIQAKEEGEADAKVFWEWSKAQGYEPWAYIFYADYEPKTTRGILSMRVTTFLYTGGPGMPHTVYYNADLKNNKLIGLGDLFIADAPYKEIIKEVVQEEMRADPERYFEIESFTHVNENTQFFIKDNTLYVTFAKYQIASGMTGEPEFLIPTEVIDDILLPEYRALFNHATEVSRQGSKE